MKLGKWIGGGIGWALAGGSPIGAILGFALGSLFDATEINQTGEEDAARYRHRTQPGDFMGSLLILTACVMKADGKIMRSELDYVKNFFLRQFGEQFTMQQMQVLKEILKKEIPVKEVCDDIRHYMEQPSRLQLLHYLYGLAAADGSTDPMEIDLLNRISLYLGIHPKDAESIKSMFVKDTGSAYKILEVEPTANEEEVKKAYRRMAIKYHPDKVSHLGEAHQQAANEKFQKVAESYEIIRKERGWN